MVSVSSTNKNKSQRNRLKNSGPNIDPYGTPWNIDIYTYTSMCKSYNTMPCCLCLPPPFWMGGRLIFLKK